MNHTVLSEQARSKQNARSDKVFYREPRFVQHVDEQFRDRLSDLYRDRIEPGARVFDLMSSWVSHLPEDVELGRVEGHGLNGEELAANPRLDDYIVQDLNADPHLPLDDSTFGVVLCAVSVQYLQHPEHVFAEVARVLRPGGTFIVSFSNRMFTQKAIRAWRDASGRERLRLVERYIEAAGPFEEPESIQESPLVSPTQRFLGGAPDPFYAVCAHKSESLPT